MKKCEYCAKEISYHQMYCDDDCQLNANKFYEKRENFSRIFTILNTIFVFAIPIGIFLFPIIGFAGVVLVAFGGYGAGIMLLLFPFPTESMIRKNKLKKAIFLTRIMGMVMVAFGIATTVFAIVNFA